MTDDGWGAGRSHAQTETATVTATPGPVVFTDDFSEVSHSWLGCEVCDLWNGSLQIGPYPESAAYQQQAVFCGPCGEVTHYRMAVDVTFKEGVSDRGFGLLLRLNEDSLVPLEITPWQTVAVWKADFDLQEWELLNGQFSGLVQPNDQTNHLEVVVAPSASGTKSDFFVKVNDRTPFVVYNQPADPGLVGLTLFGHAQSVLFDNFEFETEESVVPLGEPPAVEGKI